ncbi:MAG: diacylglycerol kinase family lipid kinase [Tissierella sp.]|nr:diacylglycerol kinase family lipid kinase [Tissierella sp.]
MNKYLFIINPIAGSGIAKRVQHLIEEEMNKNNKDFEIVLTTKPKEATLIAANKDYDIVVAVGGDGTINEVTSGLLKKDKGILGIIPAGTGNDLSRSLGIPLNPREALERILKGNTKEIAAGESNGHHFLNISSVGFDVAVLTNLERVRKRVKGRFSYVLAVIFTLMKFVKKTVTLDIDGEIYYKNLLLLAVGNGKYYGGGMMVLPNADLFDDYLHVCLIKDISNLRALTIFPVIFKGNHLKFTKYVEIYKAKSIKITCNSPLLLNVDGEVLEEDNEINFKLSYKKIPVLS